MSTLVVIPARGGSKGIPGKNMKDFGGQPLIKYSIDLAKSIAKNTDICTSSDDSEIIDFCKSQGLDVPFVRPSELSSDNSSMSDVLIHVIRYYENERNISYDNIILLQPTSPFRTTNQILEAQDLYDEKCDMIASVSPFSPNPYFVGVIDSENGFSKKLLPTNYIRRQDCPTAYAFNGAIYIINVKSLKNKGMQKFDRIRLYIMKGNSSVDLDTEEDWEYGEYLLKKNVITC